MMRFFIFLHTEPFRRWLSQQAVLDNAILTAVGILVAAVVLL